MQLEITNTPDINIKLCPKCNEEKSIDRFSKCKSKKDGLQSYCKNCRFEMYVKYKSENKEKIRQKSEKYRKCNKQKIQARNKKYKLENKDKVKLQNKKWYFTNVEKAKLAVMEWRKKNPDMVKSINDKHFNENKEKITERNRNWDIEHPEKGKERNKRNVDICSNGYVVKILVASGFLKEQITPELIEVERLIIKTRRLCKTLQNSEQASQITM